jgi:hypothetical protein
MEIISFSGKELQLNLLVDFRPLRRRSEKGTSDIAVRRPLSVSTEANALCAGPGCKAIDRLLEKQATSGARMDGEKAAQAGHRDWCVSVAASTMP